jgi:hypothetical protein
VIDASAEAALSEALAEPGAAAELREPEAVDRLSPWFLIGVVVVQLSWMGGLAYLLVRVL